MIKAVEDIATAMHGSYHFDFLHLLLPVGISFYTFHSISYVIDVYNGRIKPEHNLARFLLFVSFFPQLVAGPIARSENLLPQLQYLKNYDYNNFKKGFILIFWGLFKKMVIADRLAIAVNHVYNHVENATTVSLIIATLFFTYQIYCDFSGYSDIALGVSKLFGVDLIVNFKQPYFSKTITEFWRRWHISLSTWFRDYLYIPLGGNKVSKSKWIFNTMLVFVVSGLWHGANYTFLIWGAIHGLMLIIERFVYGDRIRQITSGISPANIIRWFITYVVVVIAWTFFRANNLGDAVTVFQKIFEFKNVGHDIASLFTIGGAEGLIGLKFYDLCLSIVFILLLVGVNFSLRKEGLSNVILNSSTPVRWSFYIAITFVVLWFGKLGINEFIYFQF
ncbi:MBOAT family protein [Mucilaginibacter sp. Mucisp84]|uniref:MBOAT family O-acyltransferase n=1 Tax=Mucilaginibacter sp. Mucisp84 TaxID=3243058 RepID=UPI0039A4024B